MSTNLGLPILIYKWKRISSPRFIGPCLHTAYPCCSVTMSCLTLCIPKNFSTPGFPVLHYLPEFAQTHVHWVSNIIQPSDPLSAPSPLALNLSQHQGLFQWVSSSQQVAKLLELQLSALVLPMNIQDGFPLGVLWCPIFKLTPFSKGSSWSRDQTCVSYVFCIGRWVLKP